MRVGRADMNRSWFADEARTQAIMYAEADASMYEGILFDEKRFRILDFIEATKMSDWVAKQYLRATAGNLDGAIQLFKKFSSAVDDNGTAKLREYTYARRDRRMRTRYAGRHSPVYGHGSAISQHGYGSIGSSRGRSGKTTFTGNGNGNSADADDDDPFNDSGTADRQSPDRSPRRNDGSNDSSLLAQSI